MKDNKPGKKYIDNAWGKGLNIARGKIIRTYKYKKYKKNKNKDKKLMCAQGNERQRLGLHVTEQTTLMRFSESEVIILCLHKTPFWCRRVF